MSASAEDEGCYPPRAPYREEDDKPSLKPEEIAKLVKQGSGPGHSDRKFGIPHPQWEGGKLKYTSQNWWSPGLSKEKRENCRRNTIAGVEVQDLVPPHFLAGEQGLFAIEKFQRYDVIGEYTGRIVDDDVSGHYVAALEDKTTLDSLGLDAQDCGNEMRFINSYLNVEFSPNVSMRTVYINTYPHICIVCIRDIDIGDEILLDYGEAYNKAYLTPKVPVVVRPITVEEVASALPMGLVDDIEEEQLDREKAGLWKPPAGSAGATAGAAAGATAVATAGVTASSSRKVDMTEEWVEETIGPLTFSLQLADNDFNTEKTTLFATMVWSGARAVSSFLTSENVKAAAVIEFGAGAGLPSLVAARLGARVVCVTDYPAPSVLANLNKNVAKNSGSGENSSGSSCSSGGSSSGSSSSSSSHSSGGSGNGSGSGIHVVGYRWGDDEAPLLACNSGKLYDLAICSECLWKADNHQVLIDSLTKVVTLGGLAYVGFSHHHPGREDIDLHFFELAKYQGWVVQDTHTFRVPDQWTAEKMNQFYIYELLHII